MCLLQYSPWACTKNDNFFFKVQSLLLGLRTHYLNMHAKASYFRGSFCITACPFSPTKVSGNSSTNVSFDRDFL